MHQPSENGIPDSGRSPETGSREQFFQSRDLFFRSAFEFADGKPRLAEILVGGHPGIQVCGPDFLGDCDALITGRLVHSTRSILAPARASFASIFS
jgi:hypothetical protein